MGGRRVLRCLTPLANRCRGPLVLREQTAKDAMDAKAAKDTLGQHGLPSRWFFYTASGRIGVCSIPRVSPNSFKPVVVQALAAGAVLRGPGVLGVHSGLLLPLGARTNGARLRFPA